MLVLVWSRASAWLATVLSAAGGGGGTGMGALLSALGRPAYRLLRAPGSSMGDGSLRGGAGLSDMSPLRNTAPRLQPSNNSNLEKLPPFSLFAASVEKAASRVLGATVLGATRLATSIADRVSASPMRVCGQIWCARRASLLSTLAEPPMANHPSR